MTTLLLAMVVVQETTYSFRITLPEPVTSVSVAGSFNGWNKDAAPMASLDRLTWTKEIRLPYGSHQYKFVVDGSRWVTDPNSTVATVNDGNGNINSVLVLLPPDYAAPAKAGDGIIASFGVRHRQTPEFLNLDRGRLRIGITVRPDDVNAVRFVSTDGTIVMREVSRDDLFARYEAEVPYRVGETIRYEFEIADGGNTIRLRNGAERFELSPQTFRPFEVPEWVSGTVMYQIFPDRFANGSRANDPADVQPWDAKPTYFNHFGGDAVGIQSKADYLASLGIGAVYFNPVFRSPANHRYEATDFLQIDPDFGTNAEFKSLTRTLEKKGVRTILDFVFNHTAPDFFAFQDIRTNGEQSPYKDWFFIKSFPVRVGPNPNYEAWYGFPSMPKVNLANSEARKYFLDAAQYWIDELPGIAGYRLDVANEVDPDFWRALRPLVKKNDPNLWIVGEVWGDARPWLGGDQWDAAMNYPFRDAHVRFFAEQSITATDFGQRLMANFRMYPPQVSRNMMNLLSSHDTPRFLTLAGGSEARQKLAAAVQFTWPGSPSIYYGEEIGMLGGADPDNRRPMDWNRATDDNELLRYYRRLIAIRNANPVLHHGDVEIVHSHDAKATFGFRRTDGNRSILVLVNRSTSSQQVSLSRSLGRPGKDLLGTASVQTFGDQITVSLPAESAAILPLDAASSPSRNAPPPVTSLFTVRNQLAIYAR